MARVRPRGQLKSDKASRFNAKNISPYFDWKGGQAETRGVKWLLMCFCGSVMVGDAPPLK